MAAGLAENDGVVVVTWNQDGLKIVVIGWGA